MPSKGYNKPSQKVKNTFEDVVSGMKPGKAMKKNGYSDAYASNPHQLMKTQGWQFLLDNVQDRDILARIYDILLDTDKRSSLTAADMLLKLKDKYPANKMKMTSYTEEMNELAEIEEGDKNLLTSGEDGP